MLRSSSQLTRCSFYLSSKVIDMSLSNGCVVVLTTTPPPDHLYRRSRYCLSNHLKTAMFKMTHSTEMMVACAMAHVRYPLFAS